MNIFSIICLLTSKGVKSKFQNGKSEFSPPAPSSLLAQYEEHFDPDGWHEASIVLPEKIAQQHPDWATVLPPATSFLPSYTEVDKIFVTDHSIPQELVSLHLWETFALPHMRQITGWGWMENHRSIDARESARWHYDGHMKLILEATQIARARCTGSTSLFKGAQYWSHFFWPVQ